MPIIVAVMFHWICPECGQGCSPTSRDCPSCYPTAPYTSSAQPAAGAAQPQGVPVDALTAVLESSAPLSTISLSEVAAQLSSLHENTESLAQPLLASTGLESAPVDAATAVLDSPVPLSTITLSEVAGLLSSVPEDRESLAQPLLALAGQVENSTETSEPLPAETAEAQVLLDVAVSAPVEVIAVPAPRTTALVPVRSFQMAVATYRPRHDAAVVDITSDNDYRYRTTIPNWVVTVFIAVTAFLACISMLLYLVLGRARS
jgi:hypothetical protein